MRKYSHTTSLLQLTYALREKTKVGSYQLWEILRTLFWEHYDSFTDVPDELVDLIKTTISSARSAKDQVRELAARKLKDTVLELCWDRYQYNLHLEDQGFEV